MKLHDMAVYRRNIGFHHNKSQKYFSDKLLTKKLNELAKKPGDAVADCRANLMLHMLLIVTNAVEPVVHSRYPLKQERHAPAGEAFQSTSLQENRCVHKTLSTPLMKPEGAKNIFRGKREFSPCGINSAMSGSFVQTANTGRGKQRRIRPMQLINNHPYAPGRPCFMEQGIMPEKMAIISNIVKDIVYGVKSFIDNITLLPVASAQELPEAIMANESLIIDSHENLYYPAENGLSAINKQNAAVAVFLHKYSDAGSSIYPDAELVHRALVYIHADRNNINELSRVLLNAVAFYGGHKEEFIPEIIGNMIIRRWIHFNIFNDTFENYFTNFMLENLTGEQESLLSLGKHLKRVLTEYLSNIFQGNESPDKSLTMERLWDIVIVPELPVLTYWQAAPFNNISLRSFDLGEIHAGLIFARQSGIDYSKIAREEAAELGKFIQVQIEAAIAPPEWIMFFQHPALLRFTASCKNFTMENKVYTSIIHDALQCYFAEKEDFLQSNNPFNALAKSLENFKSRTTLAEEIIQKNCPQLSLTEYLIKITPICSDSMINRANNYIPISCVDKVASLFSAGVNFFLEGNFGTPLLPNIDDIFIAQNKALGEKFGIVDRILLVYAWSGFFDVTGDYWSNISIEKLLAFAPSINPKFGFRYCQSKFFWDIPDRYGFSAKEAKIILDPNNELFVLKRFNKQMIYSLSRQDDFYKIDYIATLEKMPHFSLDQNKIMVCLKKIKDIKPMSTNFEELIESIVTDHKTAFVNKLYNEGYDKHFVHKAKDFLLSLIPFYSCIDNVIDDPVEETLLDCGLDIISLIPVIGQVNKVMAKSSLLLMRGIHLTGRNALIMAAARNSIKDIAKRSAKSLMINSLIPASKVLSFNEIITLTKGMVRVMDPGFEIIYFVSKRSFQQAISLSQKLEKSLPKLSELFERTRHTSSLFQSKTGLDSVLIANDLRTKRKIGVKLLNDQIYHGRQVYATMDPETGILFGPKLFLTKKNHLRVIPIKFSIRIKTILAQGLGGKGGPSAARKWGADSATQSGQSGSSSSFQAASSLKTKFIDINEHGVLTKKHEIQAMLAGEPTSVIYDLSHNVFYLRKNIEIINNALDHIPQEKYLINSAGSLEKYNDQSLTPATLEAQHAAIKMLEVNLLWNFPAIKISAASKKFIPRKITSIWVGNNNIPQEIIKNLQNNALKAKIGNQPYDFKLYLSSADVMVFKQNMERLNKLAKDVVIINLEYTDYYRAFSQTKFHKQFLSAIKGNKGVATNFASACDILRLDLVNRRGGIYVDVDDTFITPPSETELMTTPSGLVLSTPVYHIALNIKGKYPNSIWGTHAGNPTLDIMLEESYRRYLKHKELYMLRPSLENKAASNEYAATLSYVTGPDLFNHVIDQYLPNEKQTREALKLFNLPVVMDDLTRARVEEYFDIDVCAMKKFIKIGNAHSWRYTR